MRPVKPEVFLVASPSVRYHVLAEYFEDVDPTYVWLSRIMSSEGNGAPHAEDLIEFAGRLCYRSWAPELNPNVTKVREDSQEYLGNIVKSGHGSVLEHANFSFVFKNVSRVFTHELVRHRAGAAYSQESMRYVRLTELPFWFPDWALEDEVLMQRCTKLLIMLEDHQRWMADHFNLDDEGVPFTEKKHKTSFMRRFAPDGVATSILATFNIRTLRHIIAMRTALSAEEEIRLVFDEVASVCLREFPNLMQDYAPSENGEWVPEFVKV